MEGRPKEVRKAMLEDNREMLSAMGKKGAERAADLRNLKKESKLKILLEQAEGYTLKDGDVLPPDPKTIADLQDKLHG